MYLRSRNFIPSRRERKPSIEGSVNQALDTIWEGDYVSDTSSESNMSTKIRQESHKTKEAGTSMRFAMFLEFVKQNQWGAKIYIDPHDNYVVRIDDQNEDYRPKPLVNYQGDRYVDNEGTLYLMVQDVENVDKWGQPIRAHGKEKEVPEAPPSAAELIGFRIINSLHVKQLVVDDPNIALYYREDEEGV